MKTNKLYLRKPEQSRNRICFQGKRPWQADRGGTHVTGFEELAAEAVQLRLQSPWGWMFREWFPKQVSTLNL